MRNVLILLIAALFLAFGSPSEKLAVRQPSSTTEVDPLVGDPQDSWSNENNLDFRGPHTCTPSALKISAILTDYRISAYLNHGRVNYHMHSDVWNKNVSFADAHAEVIAELEKNDGSVCERWLNNFYVIAALHSYGHFSNDLWMSLHNVALTMSRQLRFRPLTLDVRKGWGPGWTPEAEAKLGKIVGTYDCESTLIYFDRKLLPFNLAAVIAHELEHFVRDKTSYWDHPDEIIHDVPTALLLDETLSVLHAGYSQLSFFRDNNRDDSTRDDRKSTFFKFDPNDPIPIRFGAKKDQKHYTLGADLNLYDKKGNLRALWRRVIEDEGFPLGQPFSTFLDQAVLAELPSRHGAGRLDELIAIIDLTDRAYFSGGGPTTSAAVAELDRWESILHDYISPLGTFQVKAVTKVSDRVSTMDDTFFLLLTSRLNGISQGCQIIGQAIREGKAGGYVGSTLTGDSNRPGGEGNRPGGEGNRPGGEGNRPGGEGNRPGDEGNRPGREGNRPGGEGNRPGGEGNRPSIPFTPCLAPEEKV